MKICTLEELGESPKDEGTLRPSESVRIEET